MLIGLTGENCSGKGTVADYLKKKGFYYTSLSDRIREELEKEGNEVSRDNMIAKGNELRKNYGPGALAIRTNEVMEMDRNYVIDSIRSPSEVKELKKLKNFFLIYITASVETRFERMKSRKRIGDAQNLEEFTRMEKAEMENQDEYKQNLIQTFALADIKIENENGFEELHKKIDSALGEISKNFNPARPSWDEYFMSIAKVVASRSNCVKRKVAAIITKDKRIISTGYNGTPRSTKNCNEGGCPRCNSFTESGKNLGECYCSHGEENAIVQSSYHGISLNGSVIYTTFSPCLLCTKMIINSGIKEVVYNVGYPLGDNALNLLKEAGIEIRKIKL